MLNTTYSDVIQNRIDQKTKPQGSLGLLEDLAFQLALMQSQGKDKAVTQININKPTMLVFAGDHGIADENVSIAPSAVTQQMVINFLNGGAAINCFCKVNNIAFKVVDCGILFPVDVDSSELVLQRLGQRTENFADRPAMTLDTVEEGLELGGKVVSESIEKGANLLMFGEMGIANTSSAAAILSAISHKTAKECVGSGSGISQEQHNNKVALVAKGVARCDNDDPKQVLAEVGGFEIVQLVGAFIQSAQQKVPVLVDGFIVSVAAYVATKIYPECRQWMIFAHKSEEHGHQLLLSELDAVPLLDLGLRLGEGTGSALALPLLQAAKEFYNNMASFESAGVTV